MLRVALKILVVAALPAAEPAVAAGSEPLLARQTVAYAMMERDDIVGCAIESEFEVAGQVLTTRVTVSAAESGNLFQISATKPSGDDGPSMKLTDVRLKTPRFDSREAFKRVPATPAGSVALSAELDTTEGAMLMQSLTVLGAEWTVSHGAGSPIVLTLPRPLAQSVRSAYLNCAGDLYRP